VCEDLLKHDVDFKDVLSDLKEEERSSKVFNDKFGENMELLKTTLKSSEVEL